jgi:hypothetical protein
LIVDSDDTPLGLKPIHRVLQRRSGQALRAEDVVEALSPQDAPALVAPRGTTEAAGASDHLVTVLDRTDRFDLVCPPVPDAGLMTTAHVVELAVSRLGMPQVRRTPDADAAIAAASRRGAVAVLLPPISRTDILDTLAGGQVMPVKATSFRPKLPPGIVVRPLPGHW